MKKIFSLLAAVLFCTSMFADKVYFVNSESWASVNAYMWADGDKKNAEWPGVAMTKTGDKAKGFDVYSYEVPEGFSNLIFNGGSGQTPDLVFNASKPYCYANNWYATLADVEAAGEPVKLKVYFVNDADWEAVYAYVFEPTTYKNWPGEQMTKTGEKANEKDIYSYEFPDSYQKIIFTDNKGTQTADLIYNSAKTYYSSLRSEWYASPSEIPTTEPTTSYYLIGSFNEWKVADANYAFTANPATAGEYKLETTLVENADIKVVGVKGTMSSWFPNTENSNYKVDAAHAGEVTIYFRPEGNSEWESFHQGGFFYIDPKSATAITNTAVEGKAVKRVVNGMLVIEKAGVRYNVMGQIVK